MNYVMDSFFTLFGPKGKRKPKREVFYFCRSKQARIIFKKSGIFLGLIIIYVFTIDRFFSNLFGRYELTPEEKEKHFQLIYTRVGVSKNVGR